MTEDWSADVTKYVSNPDTNAISAIVQYCGIALQKRNSSLVSFSGKEEIERVRTNFLKKNTWVDGPQHRTRCSDQGCV